MGILKRFLANTSQSLLTKLSGSRDSHQLVCMSPSSVSPIQIQVRNSQRPSRRQQNKRSRKRQREQLNSNSLASSFEAEMMASVNRMPALAFHQIHGPNAELSPDGMSARRTSSFCQAIVFSDRIVMPNERIYIRVLDIARGWNGTIRFGFTACDPEWFRYEMPKHACPDMTNAGHTWAHALADELVRRDTVIHFSYNTSGFISYGINNHDCGVFAAKVKTSEPLWAIIDIYGLTTAVELVDPRAHGLGSGLYNRGQSLNNPVRNQNAHPSNQQRYQINRHHQNQTPSRAHRHGQEATIRPLHNDNDNSNTISNNNINIINNTSSQIIGSATSALLAPPAPNPSLNQHHLSHTRRAIPNDYQSMNTIITHTSSNVNKSQSTSIEKASQNAAQVVSIRNNNTKSYSKKDKHSNNNSTLIKDCPICFERPINCVLYQCGHMCTCYECGVKQWRSQSRTCPICRTVIKDVIKTYLA